MTTAAVTNQVSNRNRDIIDYMKLSGSFLEAARRIHEGHPSTRYASTGMKRYDFRTSGRLFTALEQNTGEGYTSTAANLARSGVPVYVIRDNTPGVNPPLIGFVNFKDKTFNLYSNFAVGEADVIDDLPPIKVMAAGSGAGIPVDSINEAPTRTSSHRPHIETINGSQSPDGEGDPDFVPATSNPIFEKLLG